MQTLAQRPAAPDAASQRRFIICDMITGPRDVAQIRLDNALLLFDEFVHATIKHPDAATLRGLEGRFAERLQIQPSYWSQIKGRSRQIGERLARQFEQLCRKPVGWMDEPHGTPAAAPAACSASIQPTGFWQHCSNCRASRSPIRRDRLLIWL